jgi:hypothetical protein
LNNLKPRPVQSGVGLRVKETMSLKDLPVWRSSLFRKTKYMVSSPQKAQMVLAITEQGVIGKQPLPMQTGFMKAIEPEVKKAWANVHALKYQIYKNGQPTEDESALVISERSYIPLDPLNTLNKQNREKLASLKDIAKVRHAQARAAASAQDANKDVAMVIIYICGFLLAFYALISLIKGC